MRYGIDVGDVVRRRDDNKTEMTIESLDGPYVWCVWFDTEKKLRRLRFRPSNLEPAR
jgi:uncharacterized protein YodC (DUF2158 family)